MDASNNGLHLDVFFSERITIVDNHLCVTNFCLDADINAQTEETQETALTLACCGGFKDVAEFLISAGADIEQGCSTPLMEAAQEGHEDLVKLLLNNCEMLFCVTYRSSFFFLFVRWKLQSPWWRWQCIAGPSDYRRACGLLECGWPDSLAEWLVDGAGLQMFCCLTASAARALFCIANAEFEI